MQVGSDRPEPLLVYDGRIGDLYRIFLVNLLLNIVTLGIWRFWGITRTRRYVWSRTSSGGSRFEYDGTGGQLFVGFLLAAFILGGLAVVAGGASLLLRHQGPIASLAPVFAFELCVLVLALGAPFSAQRYRLGYTVWRGIRGGMTGSMLTYGLHAMLYFILSVLTLYQLVPWASLRLLERKINASSFGNQRFACRGNAWSLYGRYLLTFLGVLVLAVVVFGSLFVLDRNLAPMLVPHPGQPTDPRVARQLLLTVVPAYLVFGIGAALISASYSAAFYRQVTSHTTLGGLRFSSAVSAVAVLSLVLGNALILLLTLGLGLPIVTHRIVRFFTNNLLATGTLDLATLKQSPQTTSRFGEGMFQVLDAGAGIT